MTEKIVEIIALENGAHRNQSYPGIVPDGWAIIPADMETPNFPYGDLQTAEVDGIMTVTKWTPRDVPSADVQSPAEQRENAYNTDPAIEWDGEMLTVTQAAQLWQYYAAEGSEKASELQTLIADAKQTIREQFPDKEVE